LSWRIEDSRCPLEFGIKVGVSITLLVRRSAKVIGIHYATVKPDWRKEEKYSFLEDKRSVHGLEWPDIQPDSKND